ncbi:hypothetical protein BCR32DRAFT_293654 [Anaeromyces robustus]|uniref:NlpC/P60 domain-containing protein n=1 Tax=Anaeromyces robustus TaxID=1754192 RepID=A0A1Y1X4L5_9FUNG|nr:hypothetical protein BCR32DRAFT_293654 [Anaeromyces robustus]|eukprot:ORX80760.1 hypothetical protein BCR32DRAFT_293654 [Anaeromyces robustus]
MKFSIKLISSLLTITSAYAYLDEACIAGKYGYGVCEKKSDCIMKKNQIGNVNYLEATTSYNPCPDDSKDVVCCVKEISKLSTGEYVSNIPGVKKGATSAVCQNARECSGTLFGDEECPGSSRVLLCVQENQKSLGQQIVDYARLFIGTPYKSGGDDLNSGVDCSGYTQQVYKHFNINIPRNADAQSKSGVSVKSTNDAQPGDLFFYCDNSGYAYHVSMYAGRSQFNYYDPVGNDMVLNAPTPETTVREQHNWEKPCRIRRFI